MYSSPPLPSPTAAQPQAPGKGRRGRGLAVQQQARRGRGWQGNAMVTRRRDAEHRASSPRWGWGKRRGQWGCRGRAASPSCPTLLLCPICEPAGTGPASSSGCFSSGAGIRPPLQAACGSWGAAPGDPHSQSVGMLRESIHDKHGWPFGCCKGVQTARNGPRHLLGTDISLFCFFAFKQCNGHAA